MEKKPERRGLGRGLSALMADISVSEPERGTPAAPARKPEFLPIERLRPNPDQPRRQFTEDDMQSLASSIRVKGVLQPLIVRPISGGTQYEIVAGERRWRAAQLAQLHEVPVLVRDLDDTEVLEVAIIENIQRADLNPIEEALAFRQLMDKFGHTQERLAEALSKTRSYIANLLRLLNLPPQVQDLVVEGKLTGGHARALITSGNPVELAERVVRDGLSVRATEELVRSVQGKEPSAKRAGGARAPEADADTVSLEQDLSSNLKMGVSIRHEAGSERGQLILRYNNLDDLDFLCQVLSMARRDAL